MKNPTRLHYDEAGDFLEFSVGKPTKCYAEEVEPGIFLRKDQKTGEIKSISILNFSKRKPKKVRDIDFDLPVRLESIAE